MVENDFQKYKAICLLDFSYMYNLKLLKLTSWNGKCGAAEFWAKLDRNMRRVNKVVGTFDGPHLGSAVTHLFCCGALPIKSIVFTTMMEDAYHKSLLMQLDCNGPGSGADHVTVLL